MSLHLGYQKVYKIEPKRFQHPVPNELRKSMPLWIGSDSGANVAPARPQLGPMLASKIDQKSILKVWAPPKAPLGHLRIDTEANLAPTDN